MTRLLAAASVLLLTMLAVTAPAAPLRDRLRDRVMERMGGEKVPRENLPAEGEALPGNGSRYVTLVRPEGARRYLLHLPAAAGNQPLPLVIALHGYGSNPAQMENLTGFSALAEHEGFAVAYPLGEGRKPQWRFLGHDAKDEDFILALIDDIGRYAPVDPRRVYVTGISNGAQMSWRMGCIAPQRFAAIAPVAGNYPDYKDCQAALPLPAIVFHGTADRLLPYDGRLLQFSPALWAADRAKQNGCYRTPQLVFQQAEVTAQGWLHCRDDASVIFYTLRSKGHSWPGSNMPEKITSRTIDATRLIWNFFQQHHR